MRSIGFNVPDDLFIKPVVVVQISGNDIFGKTVSENVFVDENKRTRAEWASDGRFGFATGDISSLTDLEKIAKICSVKRYMSERDNKIDVGFYVYNNSLWIFVRNKVD